MNHAHTSVPNTKPIHHPANLRLTPQTPKVTEGPPSSSPQAPKSPSPSSPLEFFLSLYLDESLTLADIAFTLGIPITEALERTEDPEFLKLLSAYSAAQEKRSEFLTRASKATATRTFARLAEHCDKPETARKAAADIIRMQPKPKPKQEEITHDLRIRAIHALAKHSCKFTREVLAPILGPAAPQTSTV